MMASVFPIERAIDSVGAGSPPSGSGPYPLKLKLNIRRRVLPLTTETQLITPSQLHHALTVGQPPMIIDVRNRSAFAAGHVPSSLSWPIADVGSPAADASLNKGAANRGVVLVSLDGTHARQFSNRLASKGYTQVYVLDGGLSAWEALGLPQHRSRRRLPLQHQVQLVVGLALVGLLAKALLLHPVFFVLSAATASLLIFDGLTRPLDQLVARFPWNRRGTSVTTGA